MRIERAKNKKSMIINYKLKDFTLYKSRNLKVAATQLINYFWNRLCGGYQTGVLWFLRIDNRRRSLPSLFLLWRVYGGFC